MPTRLIQSNWEQISHDMQRLPVPGGWIVRIGDQKWNPGAERYEWYLAAAVFVPKIEGQEWCSEEDKP